MIIMTIVEDYNVFEDVLTDPYLLQLIINNLDDTDLVTMKQVSKEERYNDVVSRQLKHKLCRKQKIKKCTKKIQNYLIHTASIYWGRDRIPIVKKMYEYLCQNRWFVEHNKNFYNVVHDKLFETIVENSAFTKNAVKFLIKLFDLEPPRYYYNSELKMSKYGMVDIYGQFIELSI